MKLRYGRTDSNDVWGVISSHCRTIQYRYVSVYNHQLGITGSSFSKNLKPYYVRFPEIHFLIKDFSLYIGFERNGKIYLPILHNVHSDDGRVCFGDMVGRNIVERTVTKFFNSEFFTSPYISGEEHRLFEKGLRKGVLYDNNKVHPVIKK